MSAEQRAGIICGDESYAGSDRFIRFEKAVQDIFGFKHVIPTHQGRAPERILSDVMCKPGQIVPSNSHFDTTRANIEFVGAQAIDCPCPEAVVLSEPGPFKGNIDLDGLTRCLA